MCTSTFVKKFETPPHPSSLIPHPFRLRGPPPASAQSSEICSHRSQRRHAKILVPGMYIYSHIVRKVYLYFYIKIKKRWLRWLHTLSASLNRWLHAGYTLATRWLHAPFSQSKPLATRWLQLPTSQKKTVARILCHTLFLAFRFLVNQV